MSTQTKPGEHRRFRFARRKAQAAILLLLTKIVPSVIDLQTILRIFYLADREHLNMYGRPIFGARYRATPDGPVPVDVAELLPPLLTLAPAEMPQLDCLSASDCHALVSALERVWPSVLDRAAAELSDPDWEKMAGDWISYEELVDEDNPERDKILEDLRDDGPWRMVL